jgi:hypothetical protein
MAGKDFGTNLEATLTYSHAHESLRVYSWKMVVIALKEIMGPLNKF